MFEHIPSARGSERRRLVRLRWVAASVAGHALLVAGISLVPLGVAVRPETVEQATYLLIHHPPPPRALPAAPPVRPKPRLPSPRWRRRSEAPPRETAEPRAPVELAIPVRSVDALALTAAPAPLALRGLGSVGLLPDSGAAPAPELIGKSDAAPLVVDVTLLAEPPHLVNRREVILALERLYPPHLQARNVEGEVMAMFVIGTDGRVEMDSVRFTLTSDPGFVRAARHGLARMRFRPAELDGARVRVRAAIPLRWILR
jgi:outer membrane biosynthesis protein TonB